MLPNVGVELDKSEAPLTRQIIKFMLDYEVSGGTLNPSSLFSEIARKAPRFRGMAQQDSHELFKHMIEGIRTEAQISCQSAISRHFGFERTSKPSAVPADVAEKIKAYYKATEPFVDYVFGGRLIQSVECNKCGFISQTDEKFNDLSLGITDVNIGASKQPPENNDDDLDDMLSKNTPDNKLSKHKQKQLRRKQSKQSKGNRRHSKPSTSSATSAIIEKCDDSGKGESCENSADSETSTDSPNAESIPPLADDEATLTPEHHQLSQSSDRDASSVDTADEELENDDDGVDVCRLRMTPMATDDPTRWKTSCHIGSCLTGFVGAELLTGKNQFACEHCNQPKTTKSSDEKKRTTVYSDAVKSYIVYTPPAVLTIHLKRFQQTRFRMTKLTKKVEFPLLFNLAPYCCKSSPSTHPGQKRVLYSLFGVVSHSGSLHMGHYVAYVKPRPYNVSAAAKFLTPSENVGLANDVSESQQEKAGIVEGANVQKSEWYYISDSSKRAVDVSNVLAAEAYLLFYERIE